MKIPAAQAEAVAFLSQLTGSPPIETAGSFLFPGGGDVFKLRKAVERPLADWRARRTRRAAALWELAVAGAPGLYRGARAVLRAPRGGLTLAEDAAPDDPAAIDWVLQLGDIPQADFATAMTGSDAPDGRQLDLIADAIVALQARIAPPSDGVPPEGATEALRLLALTIIRLALEAGLPQPPVMDWAGPTLTRLEAASALLDSRAAAGLARPGHGNLHLGNIARWKYDWVLLDPRPADPANGAPDIAWDLAPLLVELEAKVSRVAANRLLSRVIARTGDTGQLALLPLLMSLRAMQFATDLAARDADKAAAYFRLAGLYHAAAPAVVVAIGGLPGVGKTTLARALAPGLGVGPGAVVLRADEIRKRLAGLAPEERLDPPADADLARQAHATLAAQVRQAAAGGHAVVADATFLDLGDRAAIRQAAADAGVPFVGLWLDAALPALQTRLARRAFDASDSTIDMLRAANLANPGALDWQRVDAAAEEPALAAARQAVAGRLASAG
jgi:predicted kinase/aminoglycoside phosphotransferase family enzyme